MEEREVRETEEISRVEEIRFRVDATKRGNGTGWGYEEEGWGGGRGDSDMASGWAGSEERREFEAVDRASNSKGLLTRARSEAGRDPACVPRWRCAREKETPNCTVRKEHGEERRERPHTRNRRHRPNFATAVPKYVAPRTTSFSTCLA